MSEIPAASLTARPVSVPVESTVSGSHQAPDEIAALGVGFEAYLDGMLDPEVQRILVTDGPAVLGLARFTELDERYAVATIAAALRAAADGGRLRALLAGLAS